MTGMTELLPLLVGLVLGVVLGAAVTLVVARSAAADAASHPATLEAERAAVQALVAPVNQSLAQVAQSLATAEQARAAAHAQLREQLRQTVAGTESLRDQTGRLASALRRSDTRGQWGEVQLRRIVESAGLIPHVHFEEQSSTRDDAGDVLRADLVVHLADGRDIVVDSKVPLTAYLDALECDDEALRAQHLARHAADLARHVDALGSKEYWRRYSSPEFVVLFLPSEALLSAALDVRPELLQRAFDKDVVVATPTTLMALLRTVAHTWRQEAAARNAREMHQQARELVARLATMGGHVDKLGAALTTAVTAYNRAVGSLETRVLVQARRLADIEVDDETAGDGGLPTPRLVTEAARPVTSDELLASSRGDLAHIDDLAVPARPTGPAAPRPRHVTFDDDADWADEAGGVGVGR